MSAKKTARFMNTSDPAAFRACLFLLLPIDEIPYAVLPDHLEILNHAHSILGALAIIQMVQHVAGKAVTRYAVKNTPFRPFFTLLYFAIDASFWFEIVGTSTSGACAFVSRIRRAKTTIHAAGSNN